MFFSGSLKSRDFNETCLPILFVFLVFPFCFFAGPLFWFFVFFLFVVFSGSLQSWISMKLIHFFVFLFFLFVVFSGALKSRDFNETDPIFCGFVLFPFCCFFRCIFLGVVLNLHPFFRQGNLGANMFFIFFVDMFFFKDKNPSLPGKVASAAKHCRFELRRTKLVATEVWHTKHFAMFFFWGGVEFAPIFPTRKSGRKHVFHLFCRYVFFL